LGTGIDRYLTSGVRDGRYRENSVRAIAPNRDFVWVGATNELSLYKRNGNELTHIRDIPQPGYRFRSAEYLSNSPICLLANEDGLWLGSEDAGLILYPGRSAWEDDPEFIYFNRLTDPAIPGNKVSSIEESKMYPGTYWIGTAQNGFARLTYRVEEAEVERFDIGFAPNELSNNNVRDILEDRDGLVWIATQNGLNCFDPQTRTFYKHFYELGDTSSINDNVINVLYEDSQGSLWVGSNAGINKKTKVVAEDGSVEVRFKAYPDQENISDEIITNILEDGTGKLWIGIYRGLARFDLNAEIVEKEYFSKEIQGLSIARNTAEKDEMGSFYYGGSNGFLRFNPDSLLNNSMPPKVCVTDLIVFNESIEDLNPGDIIKQNPLHSVAFMEQVKLSHKSRVLTFVFSAMDYKDPKHNEYKYMLEGFDSEWVEVGTRNSATYTNIRPGKYVFKVLAANSDGIWSEEAATMSIIITTPWWRSRVAIGIYLLLLTGLLYFFNQYSIIGVREKSRIEIERLQFEKEHELNEEKTLFFTNITHEFRTPLTLILGPAEELLKSKEPSSFTKKQVDLIQRNAQRLLRLVNQLMEFRKLERGKMEIYLHKTNVVPILNDLYESFRSMADSKKIDFSLIMEKNVLEAMIDQEKFEKVMFNLLSNAFKFSNNGDKIILRGGLLGSGEDQQLLIEVEDTGIGIPAEYQEKVFERFFQVQQKSTQSTGGIGLYLSKTFIEMQGGRIELESEAGQGSIFRIKAA